MSLFKPSNLSPNFESVTNGKPLTITFQVNSNGSTVNAYRVQILKDVNDKDNSEDNILGSIYGTFEKPLYNKDIGEIILEEETLKYNGIELEPNKDYRWTLRLYGEDKRGNNYVSENLAMGFGTANAIKGIDIAKPFVVNKNNLFNIKESPTLSSSNITYSINDTIVTFKSNSTLNAHFYYSISVRVGETYTIGVKSVSWNSGVFGIFLSSTKTADLHDYGQINKTTLTQTFVATTDTLWIHAYINYDTGDYSFSFDELKVERGSKQTNYTSYSINDGMYSDTWEDYGLIVSQDDISGILNNLIYSLSSDYDTVDSIEDFSKKIRKYTTKFSIILFSEIQDKTQQELNEFFKNKIHPKMYFYQINISKNTNGKYLVYFDHSNSAFSFNYYKSNYQEIYNEDLTYIGSGNLVGSTRQTMWSTEFNEAMKVNSYARIIWRPSQYSYFQPFKFNTQTIACTSSGNNAVAISANDIKKEYIDKITDGNFYILLSSTKTPFDSINFELTGEINNNILGNLRKIEQVKYNYIDNKYYLIIPNNETIPNLGTYNYLAIVYIQQEKIIQVDKNIGNGSLTRISFEEAFNYNPNSNPTNLALVTQYARQYLHLGYVNDDFDYDRFYIDPVEEFDNSTGFSYIILQKNENKITGEGQKKETDTVANISDLPNPSSSILTKIYKITNSFTTTNSFIEGEGVFYSSNSKVGVKYISSTYKYYVIDESATDGSYITQTRLDKLLSSTDQTQVGYKIINYVGKTGEVTIYNKAKNLPTIQTFYYIYKRSNSDNTKYDKITSGWLGGKQENSCDIVVNKYLQVGGSPYSNFENIFIQPNIGIKEDDYMPMKLSVYNEDYAKDIYLTNYYNFWDVTTTPFSIANVKSNTEVVDTLDDTMWLITAKEITDKDSTMMLDDDSLRYALYEPQTQYKIYTNFVDSIPEGFFYSRYDKTIKFEIYDLNTYEEKEQIPYVVDNNVITYNGEKVDSIPYRDLYVKSICQDYKLIDRSECIDKYTSPSYSRSLNGEQYFIGLTCNNYLIPNNITYLRIEKDIWKFKPANGNGYGIGYDIRVKPNTKYTVKAIGENVQIRVGQYDINGNYLQYIPSYVGTFTTDEDVEWITVVVLATDWTQEASYSQILFDGKNIIPIKEELGTNYVTLKEYHFDVLTDEQKVVYSTEESYDGKYKLEFRGCNNNSTYYIKSYIEDNYGKLYTYQARIPIKYIETLSDTNINVTTICEEQAIKVDFTPVRQIESSGSLIYNEPYTDTNYNNDPLTFYEYDNNIISIPSEFSYCVQFKLDSNMLDKNTRLKILEVVTDNENKYNLYFDTEAYFKVGEQFAINKTYTKFILSNRDLASNENITKDSDDIKILNSGISDLVIPTQFAYIIQENDNTAKSGYIYIMPSKISDIYLDDRAKFKETVPSRCLNGDVLSLTGQNTYYVETNNEDYINANKTALTKMGDLTFKMTVKYDSTTKKYKISKATIS